jgi:hypothetical protein
MNKTNEYIVPALYPHPVLAVGQWPPDGGSYLLDLQHAVFLRRLNFFRLINTFGCYDLFLNKIFVVLVNSFMIIERNTHVFATNKKYFVNTIRKFM